MRNWKRLLIITITAAILLAAAAFALGIYLTHFLVDFWWFSSLDYGSYFWLRVLYRYFFSAGVTILFFLIFFLNFWAASRYLGVDQTAFSALTETDSADNYKRILKKFQAGSLEVYTPLSVILAVLIAAPFYQHWESALLFFFGPESGVNDPVYQNDVSFYLFRFPIFLLIQSKILIASALAVLAITTLYWIEHHLIPSEKKDWPIGAKIHLGVMVFITALIVAWGLVLDRQSLLYTAVHEPVFFGPGFVELRYVLPMIWLQVASLMAGTLFGISFFQTGKGLKPMLGFVVILLLSFGLRHTDYIPKILDRFIVKPNPVKIEQQFMENNIKASLAAYDLDQVKTIEVTAATGQAQIDPHLRENIYTIPIWDPEYLDDVYQQLQGIRPYYQFADVDVARYQIDGRIQQVNLAPRELNIAKLPAAAQNWENTHLRYTHGFGAVITPASQSGETPMQWFLRDLELESDVGFRVEKPDVYFGLENLGYAVVPNKLNIVDIASFDVNSSQNYTGRDGMPVSSVFRRLLYAIFLKDEKLFFSLNINEQSKVLIRRNIVERIKTLTPYLSLDHDPYIVVTPTRIFWIQDAYTTSSWYPVSQASSYNFARDGEDKKFNYIRNSVKIVVDAFGGSVDYYIADPKDPIIQGYRKAYPGLFKDIEAMPPLLQEQLRYPRDFFSVQMSVYSRYHQTNPALFYQQAETWDFSKVGDEVVRPYYLTTYLEGAEELDKFILLNPMTPIGRTNLSVLGVAGMLKSGQSSSPYARQLLMYKFSKEVQVNGPSQVSALIDQEPEISRLFTLWDQRGSSVKRGRIIILPIGRSLLYVQPIYLVSTADTKIPQLIRVVVSMGNEVVMDTSLEKALDALEAKLREHEPAGTPPILKPQIKEQRPTMTPLS